MKNGFYQRSPKKVLFHFKLNKKEYNYGGYKIIINLQEIYQDFFLYSLFFIEIKFIFFK